MGASPSNTRQKAIIAQVESWPGFLERTCISPSDLTILATSFRKACAATGDDDFLLRSDLEHWMEIGNKSSSLERRVYDIFRVNSPEDHVGLYDFMVSIWNYCVDDKARLSGLAFDIYDRHTSGSITEADLEDMLIDVWGPKWEDDARARSLMAERTGADPMTPEHWGRFCVTYPNLLHPVYKVQRTLQELTLGRKRWAKIGERIKQHEQEKAAEQTQRLQSALTEEDKQEVLLEIAADAAHDRLLKGNKSERLEAAKAIPATEDGVPLLPSSSAKRAPGPSSNTLAKSLEVRDRLAAARDRSDALGSSSEQWISQTSSRTADVLRQGQTLPKFTFATKRAATKAGDYQQEGGRGEKKSLGAAATPGSNGSSRSPLGSQSNINQSAAPTHQDAGMAASEPAASPRIATARRIGASLEASRSSGRGSDNAVGSNASDEQRNSKVPRPARLTTLGRMSSSASTASSGSNASSRRALAHAAGRSSSAAADGPRHQSSSVVGGGGGSKRADAIAQRISYAHPGKKSSRAIAAGS